MFGRRRKEEEFKVFPMEQAPDVEMQHNGIDIKIYFMENYEKGAEAIKRQLTFVERDETTFSILLEKELYELAPELYTKESLAAQHGYFATRSTINPFIVIGGGFGIMAVVTIDIILLAQDVLLGMTLGIVGGLGFMLWVFVRTFNKDMERASTTLRATMTELYGEEKLDELVQRQEQYAKQKRFEENPE
jgi:hypothetical protein